MTTPHEMRARHERDERERAETRRGIYSHPISREAREGPERAPSAMQQLRDRQRAEMTRLGERHHREMTEFNQHIEREHAVEKTNEMLDPRKLREAEDRRRAKQREQRQERDALEAQHASERDRYRDQHPTR